MNINKRHLSASKGMVLTNGELYVVEVWLGNWDSPDNWWEITLEEAKERQLEDFIEIEMAETDL